MTAAAKQIFRQWQQREGHQIAVSVSPMSGAAVLVVDDDEADCDSVRELLSTSELMVEAFKSVEDFLGAFEPTRFACLLLDVRAVRRSGPSRQEELVAAGCPIVLICDHRDNLTTLRLSKAAAGFLQKPYVGHKLIEAIQEALGKGGASA